MKRVTFLCKINEIMYYEINIPQIVEYVWGIDVQETIKSIKNWSMFKIFFGVPLIIMKLLKFQENTKTE